jgi:transketolase
MNDIALMASLPHMQVWAPGDANDLKFAMHQILTDDKPAYLRFPRRPLELLPGDDEASPCRWLGEPQTIALLGTGLGTHFALAVQDQLSQSDLPVGVLHCPQVSPLPRQALAEALEYCEMIFVIEDHYRFSGLAGLLQELDLPARIISFGWPNGWSGCSGNDEDLLIRNQLAPDQIARNILAAVENSTRLTSGVLQC